MERRIVLVLMIVCSVFTTAFAKNAKDRMVGPVATTGFESVSAASVQRLPGSPLDDEGGTPNSTYAIVGTTWYDYQTNGTNGKQIAVDPTGKVHVAWTNGEQDGSAERHIYYNVWDPELGSFLFNGGVRVDAGSRAGFTNMAAGTNGFGFPAFHEVAISLPHATASIDFLPTSGAFTGFEVPYPAGEPQIIWPHIDMDINGKIHMVATESGGASADYYARGVPQYDGGFGLEIVWEQGFDTPFVDATFITMDVACSRQSEKVAVAWIADPVGDHDSENIWMKVSNDGGETWGNDIPVTNIPPIDTMCVINGGDWITCNADTFRPWVDLSIILDDQDNVHIAYTAQASFYFDETGAANPAGYVYATLWHWGEDREEFSLVNQAYFANDSVALGVNNLMSHRPSLAIDTTTDYLYCSFQQFDQHAYSDAGYPMGEFYMTVSTDNGQTWAVPTNVSNTPGEPNQVTGEDPSERDITTAKYVTNGIIHTMYQHDYAAGSAVAASGPEGPTTLNEMIYMQIPVGDIPTDPRQEIWAFRADSTGFPQIESADERAELPTGFMLHQNYPNPFNPTTHIQFDLAKAGNVSLTVFDVTGRQVATLLDNENLGAGVHTLNFDATGLSSGVYFSRLDIGGTSMTRKMVLLK